MTAVQSHSYEEVLVALTTAEEVGGFLRRYTYRDPATMALEDDIAIQRKQLLSELRAITRATSAAPIAARMTRDDRLRGSNLV